jgi:predicted glycogen debranching enzyme
MSFSVPGPDRSAGMKEWLESDGLGGFASGTVAGIRTRRYHGLLLAATTPPTGRMMLVNGFDARIETVSGPLPLNSQFYSPEVVHPDGAKRIEAFGADPWPRWRFRLEDGTRIEQEIFVRHGAPLVALSWRVADGGVDGGLGVLKLCVRPFLSGRDYHSMHHENPAFRFDPERGEGRLVWRPYDGVPGIVALTNGDYRHEPAWYRNFAYAEERERGLDSAEDLAAPGVLSWDLTRGEAVLIFAADLNDGRCAAPKEAPAEKFLADLRSAELSRRKTFPSRLHRAADAYIVHRGAGKTIVAGYPWFTDWGRDTFIALRGLCIATGRLDDARAILLEWAGAVSAGMLPNRFPDRGEQPEFNSVDASLWYIVAVHDFLRAMKAARRKLPEHEQKRLHAAIDQILQGHAVGTRYGIRLDSDGLLAAGEPGVQLTWMDAKVGDWVVTPRIGKPVEVQALWLNALKIGSAFNPRWKDVLAHGREAFHRRFWNDARGYLHDVVDPNHQSGTADATCRANQIFAVGGLPYQVLEGDKARRMVDAVEALLATSLGLRSLAQGEPGYASRYQGGVIQRDGAYHQGTVWPWLLGPFVEAWVRVRCGGVEARQQARARFLNPLLRHLDEAGLGHISEIADADPPHTPRGCPFQAWSVGEALRLDLVVLAETPGAGRKEIL